LVYPYKEIVSSTEETADLALRFSSTLKGGEVIVLNGTLGAGKTFFIKKAGSFFNINNINSPTFSIVNVYEGKIRINHFDFYRINSASELLNIGFDDYLNEEESIKFIEWGNLYPEVLPEKRIEISILVNQDYSREFIFSSYGN
jgi:tRNA threonylcarbamoyladenosine biosynthesis protein TsaE